MTGVEPKLIEGGKGIFDVKVDGRLIYSKYETDRHAEPGEVGKLVATAAAVAK